MLCNGCCKLVLCIVLSMVRVQTSSPATTAFARCVSLCVTRCDGGLVCMISSWKLCMVSSSLYDPQWLISTCLFVIRVPSAFAINCQSIYWQLLKLGLNSVSMQMYSNYASVSAVCWMVLGCGAGSGQSFLIIFLLQGLLPPSRSVEAVQSSFPCFYC